MYYHCCICFLFCKINSDKILIMNFFHIGKLTMTPNINSFIMRRKPGRRRLVAVGSVGPTAAGRNQLILAVGGDSSQELEFHKEMLL